MIVQGLYYYCSGNRERRLLECPGLLLPERIEQMWDGLSGSELVTAEVAPGHSHAAEYL